MKKFTLFLASLIIVFSGTWLNTNALGNNMKIMEDYILVDWVGIEDFNGPNDFRIYPNPGTGIFVIQFASVDKQNIDIEISNSEGVIIHKHSIVRDNNTYVLDLKSQPNGLYLVNIYNGKDRVLKKLSIVK